MRTISIQMKINYTAFSAYTSINIATKGNIYSVVFQKTTHSEPSSITTNPPMYENNRDRVSAGLW